MNGSAVCEKKDVYHNPKKDVYRNAVKIMLQFGVPQNEIYELTVAIVSCFRQGTGLVWSEAQNIVEEEVANSKNPAKNLV